jgi:hypothetical protein
LTAPLWGGFKSRARARPHFASLDLLLLPTCAVFSEKAHTAKTIDIAELFRRLQAISVSKSTEVVLKANIGANHVLNY